MAKLALLYGPPAVGKLTVAKELKKLTGFKLFDNHQILDVINKIFGQPERKELGYKIRKMIVEQAALEKIDLIVTGVVQNHNRFLYESMVDAYKNNGGNAYMVHLTADKNILLDRVEDESRRNKFNNKADLQAFIDKYPELFDKLGEEDLAIDTSSISPNDVAQKIVDHFKL